MPAQAVEGRRADRVWTKDHGILAARGQGLQPGLEDEPMFLVAEDLLKRRFRKATFRAIMRTTLRSVAATSLEGTVEKAAIHAMHQFGQAKTMAQTPAMRPPTRMPVPLARLASLDFLRGFIAAERRMSLALSTEDLCCRPQADHQDKEVRVGAENVVLDLRVEDIELSLRHCLASEAPEAPEGAIHQLGERVVPAASSMLAYSTFGHTMTLALIGCRSVHHATHLLFHHRKVTGRTAG